MFRRTVLICHFHFSCCGVKTRERILHFKFTSLQKVITPPELGGTYQPWRPCALELVAYSCPSNCSSAAPSGFGVECQLLKLLLRLALMQPPVQHQPFRGNPAAFVVLLAAAFCSGRRASQIAFETWSVSL